MTRFAHAIARRPASNFLTGITTSDLGVPDYETAYRHHAAYCSALTAAGLDVTVLEPDARYPDSTFVEDTAVIAGARAMLTRPGAPSRLGEVAAMREPLWRFFEHLDEIRAPGTLDGGDVCEAGSHVFIGVSHRTNSEGAQQLAAWLARDGNTAALIDIRDLDEILHLKSGMAYVGNDTFVVIDALLPRLDLGNAAVIRTLPAETYGANCIAVNDVVLLPTDHPQLQADLTKRGFTTKELDVSEYRKMDGGLSCLSLRF